MGSGLDTNRDFQTGIKQEWHRKTNVVEIVERKHFPAITTVPMFYSGMDGQRMENGQHIPICEDDSLPAGDAFYPDSYTLFTPHEAWDYVHEVLAGTDFRVESIAMLKNRTFWFISVFLTELQKIAKESIDKASENNFYLNFSGGLNRQISPQAELIHFRAVCWNTISASRAQGEVLFKARATKNFSLKLEERKEEFEKAVGMAKVFTATLNSLAETPCNVLKAERIYTGFLAPETVEETGKLSTQLRNTVEEVTTLFNKGLGNRGQSMADVLNGFTQLRTRGSSESKKNVWKQYESSEIGLYADEKAEFINLLADEELREETEERGKKLLALA